MIITVDIGNTTTSFGVFEQGKLISQFSVATKPDKTPDEITLELKALAKTRRLHLKKAKKIIICSVVPRMCAVLVEALSSLRHIPMVIVGQDIEVPLINKYTYPEQVGQDRLVGAYAAWREFKKDCIVADFGTAITIDIVTKNTEYLGGIIAPGLEISLDALARRTALLPKVELRPPPEVLGRDTANSIRAGILYGCASLCDGIIRRFKEDYVPKAVVIGTGGSCSLTTKYTTSIGYLRRNLVLQGLFYLSSVSSLPRKKARHPKKCAKS